MYAQGRDNTLGGDYQMAKNNDKMYSKLFIVLFLIAAVFVTVYAAREFSSPYSDARRLSGIDNAGDYAGFRKTDRAGTTANRSSDQVSPETKAAACTEAVSRFRDKLAEYEVKKEERLAQYEEAKTNALSMLGTMDEMGYNTELARQNISLIDGRVASLETELDGLVAKWRNKSINCNDTDSYSAIMAEAQTDLARVRSMVEEITLLAREAVNSVITQVEAQ